MRTKSQQYLPKKELVTTPLKDPAIGLYREVVIDWNDHLTKRRQLEKTDMPPYLLLPEIQELLAVIQREGKPELHFLINTLWHTGARISEALDLRRENFHLNEKHPYIEIPNAKRGKKKKTWRILPLADEDYVKEARLHLGGRGGRKRESIFTISPNAAWKYLTGPVARRTSVRPLSPHVLRHSFAVNAVLHLVPIGVLRVWMGHSSLEATSVYTQILSIDTFEFMKWVRYNQ